MRYPVVIHKDEDSDYGVIVPGLPGCFSAGATIDEVLKSAEEAIALYVESLLLDGEPLPSPKSIEGHIQKPEYEGGVWALVEVGCEVTAPEFSEYRTLLEACENPPEPGERLKEAVRRHKEKLGTPEPKEVLSARIAQLGEHSKEFREALSNTAPNLLPHFDKMIASMQSVVTTSALFQSL